MTLLTVGSDNYERFFSNDTASECLSHKLTEFSYIHMYI